MGALICGSALSACRGRESPAPGPRIALAAKDLALEPSNWSNVLETLRADLLKDGNNEWAVVSSQLLEWAASASVPERRCSARKIGDAVQASLLALSTANRPDQVSIRRPLVCQTQPAHLVSSLAGAPRATVVFRGLGLGTDLGLYRIERLAGTEHLPLQGSSLRLRAADELELSIDEPSTQLGDETTELALRFEGSALASVAIRSPGGPVDSEESSSLVAHGPTLDITPPPGRTLLGGGCEAEWSRTGQLLTVSAPSPGLQAWRCAAKEHEAPELASLAGFALHAPASWAKDLAVTSSRSAAASHPVAVAKVAEGFTLIGGGCSLDPSEPGNLLVASHPMEGAWVCRGKDHVSPSPSKIEAFAIGLRIPPGLSVVTSVRTSGKMQHPMAVAELEGHRTVVVGGGCSLQYDGPGNMVWASYPNARLNGWVCGGKDHKTESEAVMTSFAIGLEAKDGWPTDAIQSTRR